MPALSDRKVEIVRTIVEAAPDRIVGGLRAALSEAGSDSVLASVRQLVEVEAEDRLFRNAVFLPVAPMCVGAGSDRTHLTFPAQAFSKLWRGLKTYSREAVADALQASESTVAAMQFSTQRAPDPGAAYDALVDVAVEALQSSEQREFRAVVELCDAARPNGAAAFLTCLRISAIVRRAVPRLPEWTTQSADEVGAPARLAYKDAVALAEDAGPIFFEMLAAHLNPPWTVLRIISAVMDKPTERYLGDSELGGFPERVMDEIDAALQAINKMDLDGGPQVGRAIGRRVHLTTRQVSELEGSIELNRENGWGKRIVAQKQSLAALIEGRLREAEKLLAKALPGHSSGFSRPRKTGPAIDALPDEGAVTRLMTSLNLVQEVRVSANYGGFSAAHTKATEKLGEMLDEYVEDVLDLVKTGGAPDPQIAQAYLKVAVDAAGLIRDDKAADLIRRRAASAAVVKENAAARAKGLDD